MVEKRAKRLGRGLDFFLSESSAPGLGDEVSQLEINSLVPSPYQPRVDFPAEQLEDLSRSIRASGLLQPILMIIVRDQAPFRGPITLSIGRKNVAIGRDACSRIRVSVEPVRKLRSKA